MPEINTAREIERLKGFTAKRLREVGCRLSHYHKSDEYYEKCKLQLEAAEAAVRFLSYLEGKKPRPKPAKAADATAAQQAAPQAPLVKGFAPGSQVKPS